MEKCIVFHFMLTTSARTFADQANSIQPLSDAFAQVRKQMEN